MRLLVLSDLHVEFAPFDAGLGAQRIDQGVDVVVLAGDIHVSSQGLVWARQTFPNKPIVYVPGNHELYENENIDFLAQPGGFIDSWGGRFLTSNTENATTGEPLGARYRILNGTSGRRVLAFGFLYNMADHANHVVVRPVQTVVNQSWFLNALNATSTYDALVFLTHMDYNDSLVDVIRAAARAVVGVTRPIL